MKIRSRAELNDALNNAISWRKKEISCQHLLIEDGRDHQQELLRRSAVVILYAHWEGFFKYAVECYLQYVLRKGLKYQQLRPNFLALSCRAAMREVGMSHRLGPHLAVVDFLLFNQGNDARFPTSFDAEDNLNSDVLKHALTEIGFPTDDHWSGKFLQIDGSLLKNRNSIAHGDKVMIDQPTYDELHRLVVELLDYSQTCIENAALEESYLRK